MVGLQVRVSNGVDAWRPSRENLNLTYLNVKMPKPVLQAMVLADHVYQDRTTGKFIIAGTFGSMWIAEQRLSPPDSPLPPSSEIKENPQQLSGPIVAAGSPYLYVALTEIHGEVPLRLRYVNLEDAGVLLEGHITVTSSDPVGVAEYCFPMPKLPMKPGTYSLDLLHDEEILGSWRVSIGKRSHTGDSP